MKRTKIVATVGPACDAPEMLDELIRSGVNVFRLNMKHADNEWHDERIKRIREAMHRTHMPVNILIDLQGPEIRLETADMKEIAVKNGEFLVFSLAPLTDGTTHVVIKTPQVFESAKVGSHILIDDGYLDFDIVEVTPTAIKAVALQDSVIKHRKSVNFPLTDIDLPSLEEGDYRRLSLTNIHEVDIIALSFTRTKEDIEILQKEIVSRGLNAKICAKIENKTAIDHLDEITDVADMIMIARGDLAVEIPFEQVPHWQKHMIAMCRTKGVPVITATQMLQSMVNNARPSRAEISDVANAVYDGTDCCMLSEETAGGKHPLITVRTMAKIIEYAESHAIVSPHTMLDGKTESALARATKTLALDQKVDAVIVFSKEDIAFVRQLSSYRLSVPIIALSTSSQTRRLLRLSYGVSAPKLKIENVSRENMHEIVSVLDTSGMIEKGQRLLIVTADIGANRSLTSSTELLQY